MSTNITKLAVALALALAAFAANAAALRPFDAGSMAQIVQAEKGKPFVVVLWSLDCEYCRASLDTLARARQQRKDLRVVTIATDPADDPSLGPMMQERLAKLGLSQDAWAFGDTPPERLRYAIDPRWHGEKPRSYWFDAKGERSVYSGVITPAVIDRFLVR
jgi:thiol-disulfide isomerase/thioredoxin